MGVVFDWWVTEALAVFTTLVLILYTTFRINYSYWKKKRQPYLEPSFPFGNTWNTALMRRSPGEEFRDVYNKVKGNRVVGIFSLNCPVLVICDPELIKLVIVKDFNHFPDRGVHIDEKTDPISTHLFFLRGDKWRARRSKLSPTFTSGKIRAMFDIVRNCANTLAEVMPVGDDVEVRELLARYATDNIASCAFGFEVDSQHNPDAEFRRWGRSALAIRLRTFLVGLGFTSPALRKLMPVAIVPKDIAEYFTRVVTDTVEFREKTGVSRNDFMQLLIQLKNSGTIDDSFTITAKDAVNDKNNTITIKEMAAEAWGFFLGGFETSSSATSFCLYELAKNQEIQKQLQNEIDDVFRKNGGELTYDIITSQMPYLEKVLCETLRMYPALPFLNREVAQDYKLPGYDCVLEKGLRLVIPVLGLHYDPKYYRNPSVFDPEHFSDRQRAARHPYSYLPFGEGPRICIGMRFGKMQVRLALGYLLSRYRFLLPPGQQKELRLDPRMMLTSPVGGIHLRVQRRQALSS